MAGFSENPQVSNSAIEKIIYKHPEKQRQQQIMIKEKLAKIRSENYQPRISGKFVSNK